MPRKKQPAKRVSGAIVPVNPEEMLDANGLTIKQRLFVDHYILCMNGTEAARRAGYDGDGATLAVVASQNLRNHKILRELERRLADHTMQANELLVHLTDIARGDIGDVVNSMGGIDPLEAKRRGKSHLIKRYKTKTITSDDEEVFEAEVEMYDRLDALKTLAKFHSLLVERVKIDDWRSELIQLLKEGKVQPQDVIQELGDDLAAQLFKLAGISVASD
jgi:hypothetical protein